MAESGNQPKFVTCHCQHCSGNIEFDSSDFSFGETREVECPHCELTTLLFVKHAKSPPISSKSIFKKVGKLHIMSGAILLFAVSIAVFAVEDCRNSSWTDSASSITCGCIVAHISAHRIGTVLESNGEGLGDTPMQGSYLIQVTLSNLSPTQKIEFSSWRSQLFKSGEATLTDDNGNQYANYRYDLPLENQPDDLTIYPGSWVQDLISFQIPVQNRKWLHLELPASKFGGWGTLRFQINN
jgi:hypothetical protein